MRSSRGRVIPALVAGACALTLVACSAQKAEPPGLTAAPTTTTDAPTPTPEADDEHHATDLSDPDGLGIVFVDTPDLTGPAASAHDAVAIFEVEYWRSQTQGVLSPALTQIASPTATDKIRYGVDRDTQNGLGYGGRMQITIAGVTVAGDSGTATTCANYADVQFTHQDGRPAVDYAVAGVDQFQSVTYSLRTLDEGATWKIEDFTYNGTTC